jgi:hypothetical protein
LHARITSHHIGGVEQFMADTVCAGGHQRAVHEHPVVRTDIEAAGRPQQSLAGLLGQLAPEREGTSREGRINRVLEVGRADDAGLAMRGSTLVRRVKGVAGANTQPGAGEGARRGAAHDAEAGNKHVKHPDLLPLLES